MSLKPREYRIGFGIGEKADGTPIPPLRRTAILNRLKHETARAFGGFTIHYAEGGWINGDGRLVQEPAATLTIITDQPADAVRSWARYVGRQLEQDSVVLIDPQGYADFLDANRLTV